MRRGTRVGQAYVAITADGSGINEEIASEVENATPRVEEAGDEAGDRYGERFSARFRDKLEGMRDRVGDRLNASLGHSGEKAGDEAGEGFIHGMSEKVKDMGDRIGAQLSDRMASKPEQVRRGIDRAFDDDFADRLGSRVGDRIASSLAAHMEQSITRDAAKIEGLLSKLGTNGGRRGIVSGNEDPGVADKVAAILGKGSRNNFINVIGANAGGLVSMLTGVFDIIGKLRSSSDGLFSTFKTGFTAAGEDASFFTKALSGGGAAASGLFTSLASSGPAALAVIGAVTAALVILVSVANALLAAVLALASTIASALVGALGIGAAAFGALAGAVGLTVLAFMSMDNTQKALLSGAMRPLHQEAIGLGQTMLTQLVPAFSIWSANLQRALALAGPLASVMGGALAQAGTILTGALSGPGVQMLMAMLTVVLPGIVTHLSGALGGFINGMSALFAALLPYVLQFSVYLENVATTFANWATSAAGQNAIVSFVDRALNSLASLWNFISAIGGLIAAVFFSPDAQNAGNSIFDSLADNVRRFTDYISSENRMQKWFATGVVFAQALGDTIVAVTRILQALNSSGVIDGIGKLADWAGDAADAFSWLNDRLSDTGGLLSNIAGMIPGIGSALSALHISNSIKDLVSGNGGGGGSFNNTGGLGSGSSTSGSVHGGTSPSQIQAQIDQMMAGLNSSAAHYQSVGAGALANTYQSAGGYLPDPKKGPKAKPKYHNPWKKWAESLIKQGPGIAAQIRNAMLSINKQVGAAVQDATRATSADSVAQGLNSIINSNLTAGSQQINTAQQAVNTAATRLAGATTKAAAKAARKEVLKAQKNLRAAQANQRKIANANAILARQEVVNPATVQRMVAGLSYSNATLADFAEARAQVAQKIEDANQKLAEAIQIRDQYRQQITDSINSFGSLMTAQAKVIDGVEQAITATDITSNLQAKLDQATKFQTDLQKLLGMGLSDAAYKQLLDAGVEQGGAYADALLNGGVGSIQQTNDLVDKINTVADSLGSQASSRLYQAGVDAAQGLVDGLMSLSAQLDAAATQLGNSIAQAVKNALGIHSPSRVLIGMMDYVGDGAVIGLDNQHAKVGAAAGRLAGQIAVSPEVARYAASQGQSPVSGNEMQPKVGSVTIITPTEDPKAVAHEAVNEIVGRL